MYQRPTRPEGLFFRSKRPTFLKDLQKTLITDLPLLYQRSKVRDQIAPPTRTGKARGSLSDSPHLRYFSPRQLDSTGGIETARSFERSERGIRGGDIYESIQSIQKVDGLPKSIQIRDSFKPSVFPLTRKQLSPSKASREETESRGQTERYRVTLISK